MAIIEFSDGFDAVGWYMDHPRAMDGDWFDDDSEDNWVDGDADEWYGAEDAAMEYAWGDC